MTGTTHTRSCTVFILVLERYSSARTWKTARRYKAPKEPLPRICLDMKKSLENQKDINTSYLGGGLKYFYFHPYLGKWSNLTNIFQMGWNHQLDTFLAPAFLGCQLGSFSFGCNFQSSFVRFPSQVGKRANHRFVGNDGPRGLLGWIGSSWIGRFLSDTMTDEQWKKGLPWLVGLFLGDEKLPSYIGIIINHYKDPYSTTSIMESRRVFFVAQMSLNFDKPDKDFRQESPFQGLHCLIVSCVFQTWASQFDRM